MLSLSPETYDLEGSLVLRLDPGSDWRAIERRVSRSATLDVGVSIYDGGLSDGDRTIIAVHRAPTRAAVDRADALCRNHTSLTIVLPDGCYAGVLRRVIHAGGVLTLTLLIRERIDT